MENFITMRKIYKNYLECIWDHYQWGEHSSQSIQSQLLITVSLLLSDSQALAHNLLQLSQINSSY